MVIRAVYDALGLITFFTAGENEHRAWPLRKGSNALKAAATITTTSPRASSAPRWVHYADHAAAGSLDAAYSARQDEPRGARSTPSRMGLLHIRNKELGGAIHSHFTLNLSLRDTLHIPFLTQEGDMALSFRQKRPMRRAACESSIDEMPIPRSPAIRN